MMAPSDIAEVREVLGITQTELAILLGVHPITVSKWERALLRPSDHQYELLHCFAEAARAFPMAGRRAILAHQVGGAPLALFVLLYRGMLAQFDKAFVMTLAEGAHEAAQAKLRQAGVEHG